MATFTRLTPMNGGRTLTLYAALRWLVVCCAILAFPPMQARAAETDAAKVERLLKATGIAYNKHTENTWSVDLTRKNIGKVRVIATTTNHIVVTFIIVAKKDNINKTPQLMEALLRANHDYDYEKGGLDEDGDMFARIDIPVRLIDEEGLKYAIGQLADSTDALFPKISGFIKR